MIPQYMIRFDILGEPDLNYLIYGHSYHDQEGYELALSYGYLPVTKQELDLYLTGEYVRDSETGQPILRPYRMEKKLEDIKKGFETAMASLQASFNAAISFGNNEVAQFVNEEIHSVQEMHKYHMDNIETLEEGIELFPIAQRCIVCASELDVDGKCHTVGCALGNMDAQTEPDPEEPPVDPTDPTDPEVTEPTE